MVLLVWVTFPAGGVYPAIWVPAACGTLALALVTRPRIAVDERMRWMDLALITTAIAIVVQLIPLPYRTWARLDPHGLPLRVALGLPAASSSRLPISIIPRDTVAALGIAAAAALLFWVCRRICEAGGTGRIVRAIAFIGLIASIAAIMQYGGNKELLYGFWQPRDSGRSSAATRLDHSSIAITSPAGS